MKIRAVLILLALSLSGCQAIGDWFDSVGEHMPVIGDRCEHWQCFTSSGQAASDANKAKVQQPDQTQDTANPGTPANAPQSPQTAAPHTGIALPEYENPPSN